MRPIALDRNQPAQRFYRGGRRIAAFRGVPERGEFEPEDWVASCTEVAGEPGVGPTRLPDGRLLRDAVEESPVEWLGPEHYAAFGDSTELLTKLLDAGERLPVHVHPDDRFSRECLGGAHGKAEAWLFLTDGYAYLGLLPGTSPEEIWGMIAGGESERVLQRMHRIEVHAGDVVYCPPGLPHAIGGGSFLIEVQQPSDLSIFLEWRDFPLPGGSGGHLGLDDSAAAQVVVGGMEKDQVDGFITAHSGTRGDLLRGAGAPFRLDRLRAGDELDEGYAVAIGVDGSGCLTALDRAAFDISRGTVGLIPWALGGGRLEGDSNLEVIVARPPLAREP